MQKETNDNNSKVQHENLFFNCSSTQKSINVYSFLLPIPPNSSSSLYMGKVKKQIRITEEDFIYYDLFSAVHIQFNLSNYLFIVGWIPIRIKQHQSISAYQIETTATSLAA